MISHLNVYSGLKVAAYSLNLKLSSFCGASARTRTSNPRLRRPMLYPVELRTQGLTSEQFYQTASMSWRPNCIALYILSSCFCYFTSSLKILLIQPRSGQRDLNSRPPAPKAGALPNCAIPRCCISKNYQTQPPITCTPIQNTAYRRMEWYIYQQQASNSNNQASLSGLL